MEYSIGLSNEWIQFNIGLLQMIGWLADGPARVPAPAKQAPSKRASKTRYTLGTLPDNFTIINTHWLDGFHSPPFSQDQARSQPSNGQ